MQKKSIARLQFITSPSTQSYLQQIQSVVMGGTNWVQLRMKEEKTEDIEKVALEALSFCMDNGATFIMNDHVDIAAKIGADGVHLGKNDMAPDDARAILGPQSIIGGTANTFDDIKRLADLGVDYIGLGPFRFTETKKNLSPVLGSQGYMAILNQCKEAGINLPVIAIGGLMPDDLPELFKTGVHGVAISSYIAKSEQPGATTLDLLQEIGRYSSANWTRFH
ncbi:thiamine phosphate synthase [Carboxylicivirga sediminis]|uniref:Thiamine-phosphate synthase n=1 Tax=Carboxylicivirga sediminis TaxID=2006564 RepID=A0A941IZH8_9BACT|nr:thiamine phosphate synthase [Carboxylicivirga sediminis]MBR8537359.1 thiamine phosphate synthase [Carboxylicivirga sediminis]